MLRLGDSLVHTTLHLPRHPSEDALENYAFHRLSEEDTACFEEHLLVCDACQEAVEATEEFILLMKAAAAPVPQVTGRAMLPASIKNLPWRNAVWGGCLMTAAILAILMLSRRSAEDPAPAPVMLASFRGAEAVAMAHAPARRPLDLAIDAPDVPSTGGYRIEIVSAAGKPAWTGGLASSGGKLTALVPPRLDAGIYWVRLYADNSELLREFGLKLE